MIRPLQLKKGRGLGMIVSVFSKEKGRVSNSIKRNLQVVAPTRKGGKDITLRHRRPDLLPLTDLPSNERQSRQNKSSPRKSESLTQAV